MSAVSETLKNAAARHAPEASAEWWRGAVIYQIYPRSYLDTNKDGVGDLAGITQKLDYIAKLGVDAIWISPFFKSPMRDYGYDVSDFCDVDPVFGSLADFDELVARAHALGVKVIVDQVYSHTSDQHPWFMESRSGRDNPKADWYVWADPREDGSPPNNWLSVFGGSAWTWDSRREQYYLHNFLIEQPDLNLHVPAVQDAVLQVAQFWLDRGVDGFRLDAVNFFLHDQQLRDNPPAPPEAPRRCPFDYQAHVYNQSRPGVENILERLRAITDARGDIFTVAEIGDPKPRLEMKTYTSGEKRLNSAYGFEFLYANDMLPDLIRSVLSAFATDNADGWPSWAFSNHDAPRAVSRWAKAEDRDRAARLYALLLMSLRGNVFLYQGDELGLPQADVPFERLKDPEAIANWPLTLGRDGARTPMPWSANAKHAGFSDAEEAWLPVDARHVPLSAEAQENDPTSVLNFVRHMTALRRSSPALRSGSIEFLETAPGVCAFVREAGGEKLVCIFNFNDTDTEAPKLQGAWSIEASSAPDAGANSPPALLPPLSGFIARLMG